MMKLYQAIFQTEVRKKVIFPLKMIVGVIIVIAVFLWANTPIARPCRVPTNPVYLQAITPLHQLVISALEIEMKRRCHLKTTQKVTVVSPNKGKKQSICNACKVIRFGKAQNNVKRLKKMKRRISELIQLLQWLLVWLLEWLYEKKLCC